MKKFLLCLVLIVLQLKSFGQFNCYVGLNPDTAFRGQTLTTTLTGAYFYMGYGSAPCQPTDIYLNQISTGTTIYASSFSIVNDSVYVAWSIPMNAPSGLYDLHADLWSYDPFAGNCIVGPQQCVSNSIFGIDVGVISGSVFYDSNLDSVFNSSDIYLSGHAVKLYPDQRWTYTDNNGAYRFLAPQGNYGVKLMSNYYYDFVNADSQAVTLGASNIDSVDFAITPNSHFYTPHAYLYGRARCNSTQTYSISYYGQSVIPLNLKIKFYHSPNTPYVSASIPPDSIVGDTIYFSVVDTLYGSGYININLQIPSIGDTVTFYTSLDAYSISGTYYGTSSADLSQIVRCSWDPNDKAVSPQGVEMQHYTLFSDTLLYHIRFQNTGTDTAYDVHILDTLNSNLDINSMRVISSSHVVTTELKQNGVVDFKFLNIMLPDSFVDKPGSQGYITYSIQTKPGLPENTLVTNRAYIYFDQNAPVLTNITDNTMVSQIPVGIFRPEGNLNVSIYPNPFSQTINVRINNPKAIPYSFMVTDLQGRELSKTTLHPNSTKIDLSSLSPGIYLYRLINGQDNSSEVGRIVKY